MEGDGRALAGGARDAVSDVGDIHPSPMVRPVRPKDGSAERRRAPPPPPHDKAQPGAPAPDDDGEPHIDEYA